MEPLHWRTVDDEVIQSVAKNLKDKASLISGAFFVVGYLSTMKRLNLLSVLTVCSGILLNGCQKSDEEINEAIVGQWKRIRCGNLTIAEEEHSKFWFNGTPEFRADASFLESASWRYCKDTCSTDTGIVGHCTCNYSVVDGHLIIETGTENPSGHIGGTEIPYNMPIPIRMTSRSKFRLEEMTVDGYEIQCSCFERVD